MTRTEPAQVKYTNRLKTAQCCLCYYQNLRNQLSWFYYKKAHFGHTEAIASLLIMRCRPTHADSRISFFLCCVELRFGSDTGIVKISEDNRVASPPSRWRKMLFFKFWSIGIIVQLQYKQAHQLTFMFVIRQQYFFSPQVFTLFPFI